MGGDIILFGVKIINKNWDACYVRNNRGVKTSGKFQKEGCANFSEGEMCASALPGSRLLSS